MFVRLTASQIFKSIFVRAEDIVVVEPAELGSRVQWTIPSGMQSVMVTEEPDEVARMVQELLGEGESQWTVSAWRQTVFGRAPDPAKLLSRAGEEFLELMKVVTPACSYDHSDLLLAAWKADAETPSEGREKALEDIKDEMADVVVVLFGAAEEYGFDLMAEVTRKMKVNRARSWSTKGDGTGQHV